MINKPWEHSIRAAVVLMTVLGFSPSVPLAADRLKSLSEGLSRKE
jgi:hypothetical protein